MSKKSIYKIANKFEFKLRKLAENNNGWPCECGCGCKERVYSDTAYCKYCAIGDCGGGDREEEHCNCDCGCKEPSYFGLICGQCKKGDHLENEDQCGCKCGCEAIAEDGIMRELCQQGLCYS